MNFQALSGILLRLPYRHYGKGEIPFLLLIIFCLVGVFIYVFIRDLFRSNSKGINNSYKINVRTLDSQQKNAVQLDGCQHSTDSDEEVFTGFFNAFHKEVFYETIRCTIPQIMNNKRNFYWTTWKDTWQNEDKEHSSNECFVSFNYKECFVRVFFKKNRFPLDENKAFACLTTGSVQNNQYLKTASLKSRKWTQVIPYKDLEENEIYFEWTFIMDEKTFSLNAKLL